MDEQTRAYVLSHECAHLKRFDHIWKPLGFLLLSVYWFNPLLWLAYILLCRDIELACDEKVVKELDDTGKAAYSEALVTASVSRRSIAACPLAFGETGVKSRVKSVLNYKKPAFWIILVAILACVAVAVCFLTVPRSAPFDPVGVWEIQESASADLYISMVTRLEFQENGTGSLIIVNNENSTRTGTAFKYTVSRKTINLLTFHGEKTELTYDTGTDSLRYRPRIGNDHLSPVNPLFWDVRYGIVNEMQHHIHGELYELVYVRAGSEQQSPADKVTEWVNYYENTDDITWDGYKEITLDAFPNVTFRWTAGSVEAIENGRTSTLFAGMPVLSVYFTDLTGDGKPDLCATVSFGSGIVDDHIVVYDYVNRQSYTLWDRSTFDYHLYTVDGKLLVGKMPYMGDKQVDYGTLVMHDGVVCCQWHSDGSFTPLNRKLRESELYGEWLVEKETDNGGNELYAFGALTPWKEYNFKEDGTVIYNETVPYSSDSELAFGHPVAYPYEVHDNYVYIAGDNTSGAFRWGQYDRDTRTLTLSYNTAERTVNQTLKRMGEDLPETDAEPTPEPIPDAVSPFDQSQYHKTVPVGEVPEEFKEVVAQNLFYEAIAGKDCILTKQAIATSSHLYTYQYTLRDRYGDLLTEVSIPIDSDSLYPGPAMIVSDGGFVATIVFEDHYRSEDQCWASEKEDVISCILKYDASGKLQWKTELPNINGYALHLCIERSGAYYFFGDLETPETKRLGVASPTDLYLLKIGTDGSILKEQTYGGSDYDMIRMVDTDGDRFVIDAWIQSTDGDFPAFSDWRITVDSDLAIVKKEQIENARNTSYVGTVDGKRIYTDDPRFRSYPDGYVRAILSYDTFDLIISENMTGVYENQPLYISSIWYLSETVYAAYDKQGNLLWKAAVDSSPDYDSMVKLP